MVTAKHRWLLQLIWKTPLPWKALQLANLQLGLFIAVRRLSNLFYRVALIANDANINEHTDPKIVIAGLKQQIDLLKAELRAAGKEPDEPPRPLGPDDIELYVVFFKTKII